MGDGANQSDCRMEISIQAMVWARVCAWVWPRVTHLTPLEAASYPPHTPCCGKGLGKGSGKGLDKHLGKGSV